MRLPCETVPFETSAQEQENEVFLRVSSRQDVLVAASVPRAPETSCRLGGGSLPAGRTVSLMAFSLFADAAPIQYDLFSTVYST